VFFDGRFVPQDEARVPVTDPGYLLGEGVFETLRGYEGVCFRAGQHLETLARGAAMFGMSLPFSMAKLVEIADEAAARTSAKNAYVRVTLTRGAGSDGDPGVLSVLSRPLEIPSDADYANGVRATIVSGRRIPPACMDPTVKSTSYAAQVLARREAVSRGVGEGEGIMLATDGSLACATMANLFLVRGDVLLTPPIATGCRAGVTRGAVLEIARARLTVREEPIDPAALFDADEAFFTSTRVECLPIASIDGKPVASRHPRTNELHAELRARIATENRATRTLPQAAP
jgi:branched-chain amino acid aminotransferase